MCNRQTFKIVYYWLQTFIFTSGTICFSSPLQQKLLEKHTGDWWMEKSMELATFHWVILLLRYVNMSLRRPSNATHSNHNKRHVQWYEAKMIGTVSCIMKASLKNIIQLTKVPLVNVKQQHKNMHLLHLLLFCLTFQMSDIYLPLLVGATVHFAQPDALQVSCSLHFPVHC